MSIYIRCLNPACRKDLPIKTKVCTKCGVAISRIDKTYRVIVRYNGKRIIKTVSNSLELARQIETKVKSELINGDYYDRRQNKIPYGEFMKKRYLPFAKEKKSYNREETLFRLWIEPIIGKRLLNEISPFNIEKIKQVMKVAGKAPRTIQYALAVIKHSINKAVDWGLYSGINPATSVKMPKINNKRTRFLMPGEVQDLLVEVKNRSQQVYEICLLSLHCGLRAGEILNLKFGDIDLEHQLIHIKNSKNGEDRVAYMDAEIKNMLILASRRKQIDPDKYLFTYKRIPKLYYTAVNTLNLNKGITDRKDKVVFHTLRHTFASWLAINGTPIYTIKELMGHKSLSMTERYSHLIPSVKKEAVKKLWEELRVENIPLRQKPMDTGIL